MSEKAPKITPSEELKISPSDMPNSSVSNELPPTKVDLEGLASALQENLRERYGLSVEPTVPNSEKSIQKPNRQKRREKNTEQNQNETIKEGTSAGTSNVDLSINTPNKAGANGNKETTPPLVQSQTEKKTGQKNPKTLEAVLDRLSYIKSKAELDKTKEILRRDGILTESGNLIKFKPGSKEEANFFREINKTYSDIRRNKLKKVRNQREADLEGDKETTERYLPQNLKNHEASARDAVGAKLPKMRVLNPHSNGSDVTPKNTTSVDSEEVKKADNSEPITTKTPLTKEPAKETLRRAEVQNTSKSPDKTESIPKKTEKKKRAAKSIKPAVIEAPKNTKPEDIEIENLFPDSRPIKFESITQAINEPSFLQFLHYHDRHNKKDSSEHISNGDPKAIEELYETFSNAHSVSLHVNKIFSQELFDSFKGEITLPEDAGRSINAHFSRLCIENPSEVKRLTEEIRTYTNLPAEIKEETLEKARILESLRRIGPDGVEQNFDTRLAENNKKEARIKELNGLINDNKNNVVPHTSRLGRWTQALSSGANKLDGYFRKTKEAAKLIKEGVITKEFGYKKDHPFAHFFKPDEKIQRGIDQLLNETKVEGAQLDDAHNRMKTSEELRIGLEKKYAEIKEMILSKLEPSEEIKKSINKAIKEKIKSKLEDKNLVLNKIESAQILFEKVRDSSNNDDGIEYFNDEDQNEVQSKIDSAIREEVGVRIEGVLKNLTLGSGAYDRLEKTLVDWLVSTKANDKKFGSKQGIDAQNFIISIIEEKSANLIKDNNLDPKKYLLAHLVANIRGNKIVGLTQ